MGAAKRFEDPSEGQRLEAKRLALGVRSPQVFQALEPDEATQLLHVLRRIVSAAEDLVAFVDEHRDLARQAGIESVVIEITVILSWSRLERVVDALEKSAVNERPCQVSLEGLSAVRRLERLVAEATRQASQFGAAQVPLGPKQAFLGEASPTPGGSSSGPGLLPALLVGLFGLASVFVVVLVAHSERASALPAER